MEEDGVVVEEDACLEAWIAVKVQEEEEEEFLDETGKEEEDICFDEELASKDGGE